jgi:hypothetical protein
MLASQTRSPCAELATIGAITHKADMHGWGTGWVKPAQRHVGLCMVVAMLVGPSRSVSGSPSVLPTKTRHGS